MPRPYTPDLVSTLATEKSTFSHTLGLNSTTMKERILPLIIAWNTRMSSGVWRRQKGRAGSHQSDLRETLIGQPSEWAAWRPQDKSLFLGSLFLDSTLDSDCKTVEECVAETRLIRQYSRGKAKLWRYITAQQSQQTEQLMYLWFLSFFYTPHIKRMKKQTKQEHRVCEGGPKVNNLWCPSFFSWASKGGYEWGCFQAAQCNNQSKPK